MTIIWCAEIGSAHKGDKSLAFELIRQAAQAGATICKFQFGWTREVQEKYAGNYKEFRYIDGWAEDLKKWCEYFGVELMASIWSMEGLETARRIGMKRYKIAHQMRDMNLTGAIFSDGKEIFLSQHKTSSDSSLYELVKQRFGQIRAIRTSEWYPTYPEEVELPEFRSDRWFGYSDHTHGIETCLLAVSRGAMYIEKHFCLDKSDLMVRDTPFSATPDEFVEMVRIGNGMRRLLDAGV